MTDIADRGYAHQEILVSTDWVADNLNNSDIRIIESNNVPALPIRSHCRIIAGRSGRVTSTINFNAIHRQSWFEALMSKIGATNDTTIVFYGDKNNWWASYALWVLRLFGHDNVKVMMVVA